MCGRLVKYRKILIFLAIITAVIMVLKLAGEIILPFIIAFVLAYIVRAIAAKISYVTGLSRKSGGFICLFIVYIMAILLSFFGLRFIAKTTVNFFAELPVLYSTAIVPRLKHVAVFVSENLNQEYQQLLEKIIVQLTNEIIKISGSFTSWLSEKLLDVPKIAFSVFVTVLASFFICFDYTRIKNFMARQLSDKTKGFIKEVVQVIANTASKMFACSLILSGITFFVLLIGLSLFGIKHSFLISLALAVLDALPMIGVGVVLIPWAAISLINSEHYLAIGLFSIFLIIIIIHNIVEPKIIGKKIGIHPILSLAAVYIGMRYGGILTVFILMFLFAVVKYLNENQILRLYK